VLGRALPHGVHLRRRRLHAVPLIGPVGAPLAFAAPSPLCPLTLDLFPSRGPVQSRPRSCLPESSAAKEADLPAAAPEPPPCGKRRSAKSSPTHG